MTQLQSAVADAPAIGAETAAKAPSGASKKELRRQAREQRDRMFEASLARTAALEQQIAALTASLTKSSPVQNGERDYQSQINAMRQELAQRDELLAQERRAGAVRGAVASVPWFNPEDAVRELLPKSAERDGRIFVQSTERIGNQDIPREMPLDEAVKSLAQSKPYLVRANVQGGSGASGAGAGGEPYSPLRSQITKWRQVKDDPVTLAKLQAEDPEYAERLQLKYIEKQRQKAL